MKNLSNEKSTVKTEKSKVHIKKVFDEDYYERGIETGSSCYTNYRWIPELTIPMAARIIEYCGIRENETILDFGCAKGYCVHAFRLLHRDAYGYDISDYALRNAPKEVESYVSSKLDGSYDWIIAKDVLEHVSYEELEELLIKLRSLTRHMFVVVPLGRDGRYVVPAYELDKTHIIRENLGWWAEKFNAAGFKVDDKQYLVKHLKENWSSYKKGNGFFVLS